MSASTRHPATNALLTALALVAAVVGAAIAAFAAHVSRTGCFIGCGEPDRGAAVVWAAAAVLSLASGPAAVSGIFRSRAWMVAAGWTAAAGCAFWLLAAGPS